jgi:site-specific recombinase XerD
MRSRRNTHWEDMDRESIELSQLIKHFESFNRSERKSPRTVEWYTYVLEFFEQWLKDNGLLTNVGAIGESVVREFILYLQQREFQGRIVSSHTVANRVRGLKGFSSWLYRERYTETNPLEHLKVPKVDEKLIDILSEEEVDRLFRAINADSALGARNTAIIALFLDAGLRLSELANLKEENVHLNERYIKVMGKGSKERMLPIGAKCHRAMLHYYYHFRPEPAHSKVDTFFLTLDGFHLTAKAVKTLIARLAKSANVQRLHPHLFRHTYATRFLLNGGDVFLLKHNLGHTTLAMVEHYRHIASQLAAVSSQSFSPLDNMESPALRRHHNSSSSSYIYPNTGRASKRELQEAGSKRSKNEKQAAHQRRPAGSPRLRRGA